MWIDKNEEIPKGFVVHHKDGNPFNNKLSNLLLLKNGTHVHNHMVSPEQRKRSRENGIKQIPRLIRQLSEWRKENPGKVHKMATENGKLNIS